jgi:hypothetical protein
MIRLLHVADVHLGRPLAAPTPELRQHLLASVRTALRRAVSAALDEEVDAVLVAGDLYDDAHLSFEAERFLMQQLARLGEAGIPCVVVAGDGDPSGPAYRAPQLDWPPGVRYVGTRTPAVIDVTDDAGEALVRVVAAGHVSAHEHDDLVATFPEAEGGVPHVGVVHAHVARARGAGQHGRYAPCDVETLRAKGYAYWALGHVHQAQVVDAAAHAWYAGTLHAHGPDDPGPRGALMVTLSDTAYGDSDVSVDRRVFAPTCWRALRLDDVAEVETLPALQRRMREAFEAATPEGEPVPDEAAWVIDLTLCGPCPLASLLRHPERRREMSAILADTLGAVHLTMHVEDLTPPLDLEAHRGEAHLAGEVLALAERAADDPDLLDALAPDALAGLPPTLRDDPHGRRRYLSRLLDGLDRHAVLHLQKDEGQMPDAR